MMSTIQPSMTPTIRFGVFTPAQEARLKEPINNPVEDVFQRHMPKAGPDLSALPEMDATFAEELVETMGNHFVNYFRGPLPEDRKATFRTQLKDIVDRLREAPFTVPETVMVAIESAAEVIQ